MPQADKVSTVSYTHLDVYKRQAMNGASELAIMKQTGHRSLTAVRKYIREGSLFRDNAATKLGL